jgi:glycine oxidase
VSYVTERTGVIVVGAGVVGLACGAELARAGQRVLILDRAAPGTEASSAAAGMLAPQIEAHAGDALLPLGLAARDEYAALARRYHAAGFDIGYRGDGITQVAFTEAREAELRAQLEAQRALGLEVEWLDARALASRQPGIARDALGALFAPRDGCVDTVALVRALEADARAAGADVAQADVCEILVRGDRVTGVRTPARDLAAEIVVLAAGAWAGTIDGVPRAVPIEPVRGQMAALPWPDGEPRAVLFGDHGYLVPRGDEALVGSTMERAGFEKATTEEGLAHLRRQAARLLPALEGQAFTRAWSGLRPMTPDGLPIIGWDPDVAGLLYATGHGRNGILLGPLTGRIVADLVARGATKWDISGCGIARFATKSTRPPGH